MGKAGLVVAVGIVACTGAPDELDQVGARQPFYHRAGSNLDTQH